MSPAPLQPIPEATQPHVDRLIGAQVGEHRVEQRVSEGRYGTIYRCRHLATGEAATLEVLRTLLVGNDREVGAANALKAPGVAAVRSSGELPDGRRYRVMELLEGESLEQRLQSGARLPPAEAVSVLSRVANVLATTHAWAVAHGCLGPSSVFVAGDAVKLIDFGLSKRPATAADDLRALGALGFALLTGHELEQGAPLPPSGQAPGAIDRLLRDLLGGQVASAGDALKRLEAVRAALATAAAPAAPRAPKTRRLALGVGLVAGLALLAAAAVFWPLARSPETEPADADDAPWEVDAEPVEDAVDEPPAGSVDQPTSRQPTTKSPRPPRRVPSARALNEEISRLEMRLRKEVRPGDDFDQGMFVLNKQRLRLAGSPTAEDRAEVARQLRAWRLSYLKR